jgi:transcriptional regulator with XRE-family HTH domain
MPAAGTTKLTSKILVTDEKGTERKITVKDAILEALRLGVSQEAAAESAGIARETLSRWLSRGREFEGAKRIPKSEQPFVTLVTEVMRARGEAHAFFEAALHTQARNGSTQAARAWLRANDPRYRDRVKVEHGGELNLKLSDELDREIERLTRELAGGGEAQARDESSR